MDIGNVEFVIDAERISESLLEAYATALFDSWDSEVAESLRLDDYGLLLEIEEGSIKGKGRIMAIASVVFAAISGYGSFSGGLRQIGTDIRDAGKFLVDQAERQAAGLGGRVVETSRNTGKVGQLDRLFRDVQAGRISPDEATQRALKLFEDEHVPAHLLDRMTEGIYHMPRYGPQLEFPGHIIGQATPIGKPLRSERRKREPDGTEGVRVQVWKDTRADRRHVVVDRKRRRRQEDPNRPRSGVTQP